MSGQEIGLPPFPSLRHEVGRVHQDISLSRQCENGQVGSLLIARNDPAKPYGIDEELAELNSDDVERP